jgi:hypothetical protein
MEYKNVESLFRICIVKMHYLSNKYKYNKLFTIRNINWSPIMSNHCFEFELWKCIILRITADITNYAPFAILHVFDGIQECQITVSNLQSGNALFGELLQI